MPYSSDVLAHKLVTTVALLGGGLALVVGMQHVSRHKNHIVIRSRGYGTIYVTAFVTALWMVVQMTRVWEVTIPCVLYGFILQCIIAVLSTIIFYRTFRILHKLAVQQKAQVVMEILANGFGGTGVASRRADDLEDPELVEAEEQFRENCCVRNVDLLRRRYRYLYAMAQFSLIIFIFLANPNNYVTESAKSCNLESPFHAAILLLVLFAVVYAAFRRLAIGDSFHMIEELQWCAVGIVSSFALFGVLLAVEDNLDPQTYRDLQVDVAVWQQVTIAVSIVLLPGLWAARAIGTSDTRTLLQPELVRVLAHRESNIMFRGHLIKEWAVENLLFYEDVTRLQIKKSTASSYRTLIRCRRIYDKFIGAEASFEVNLSSPVAQPIHCFFARGDVRNMLMVAVNGGRHRVISQSLKGDFISTVQKAHIGNPVKVGGHGTGHGHEEKLRESKRRLISLVDECMDLLNAARTELYRLLAHDSYNRFCKRQEVQEHFKAHKALLLGESEKKIRSHSRMAASSPGRPSGSRRGTTREVKAQLLRAPVTDTSAQLQRNSASFAATAETSVSAGETEPTTTV